MCVLFSPLGQYIDQGNRQSLLKPAYLMHDALFDSNAKPGTLLFACTIHGSGETGDGIEPVDLPTHKFTSTNQITGLEPSPAIGSNRCASTHQLIGRLNGCVDMFVTLH